MLSLNKIYNMDCLDYMRKLEDDCIDLIVTSPPYANQRKDTYGGIEESKYKDWFIDIAKEIHRVLKPTGSFILNIKEHVKNGVRSTYVMETVLELSKLFLWKDTFIWNKTNPFPTGSNRRLKDGFEYCYWFTKTNEYKCFPDNVLVKSVSEYADAEKRRVNREPGKISNGSGMDMHHRYYSAFVRPSNVISFPVQCKSTMHPATFPSDLPDFFIKLFTEENDIVYDPFCGSGTTCISAKTLDRKYIGTDIVKEYVDYANKLIDSVNQYEILF